MGAIQVVNQDPGALTPSQRHSDFQPAELGSAEGEVGPRGSTGLELGVSGQRASCWLSFVVPKGKRS